MNIDHHPAKTKLLLEVEPRCITHRDKVGCNIAHYSPTVLRWHPELAAQTDQFGRYPIHTAALTHSWHLDHFIEHAPLDISHLDNHGRNALHYAVQQKTVMPKSFDDIKHELELANEEAMRFRQSDHIELVDQLAQTFPLMLTQKTNKENTRRPGHTVYSCIPD